MAPRSAGHLDRPSSSSGTRAHEGKRTDFEKRKSRDDLYLMTMTAEKQQQKFRSFHTPNRNRFMSVDSGGTQGQQQQQSQSQSHQHQKFAVAPLRQPPPQISTPPPSSSDSKASEAVAIGMALGSPAHPPVGTWAATWQPQPQQAPAASPLTQVTTPEAPGTPDEPSQKPRGRKWSLFSRSKSKKGRTPTDSRETSTPQPQQYLQKQPSSQHRQHQQRDAGHLPRTDSSGEGVRPDARRQGSGDGRSDSSMAGRPKYKPIVIPYEPTGAGSSSPSPKSQRPVPSKGVRPNGALGGPLLDVQIPDITMERYSIMFGQVLKRPPGQQAQAAAVTSAPKVAPDITPARLPTSSSSSVSSSSSLLARRQATLGRLKTIEDETIQRHDAGPLEPPRMRRASSSQTKQSPALYLFPPNVTPGGPARSNSPRGRSFTSPAGMPLPSRPAPEPPIQRLEQSRAQTFPNIGKNASLNDNTMSSSPQGRPRLASKFQRKDSQVDIKKAGPIVDSPSSMSMGESSPELSRKEPPLDTITPPTSTTDSRTSTPKKDSISSIGSETVTVVKPAEETVEDRTMREAVQASITRQISVSREQREMLRPFRSQSRHGRKVKPLGAENIAIGENERIAETKKATPTLVHPDPDALSPKSHHVYRRSEQVVFDAA